MRIADTLAVRVAIVVMLAHAAACDVKLIFTCEQSAQCRLNGTVGVCEPDGTCAFPAGSCPSGYRYDSLGAPDVAGTCTNYMTLMPAAGLITLDANADAFVDMANPAMNAGPGPTMMVDGNGGGVTKRSYVSFDVSSIAAGSMIDSATLTLCMAMMGGPATGHTHELLAAMSSWSATTITWNMQPMLASVASATTVVPSAQQCVTFAVKTDVQAWVNGTANNGWCLRDQNENSGASAVGYVTKESSLATQQPALEIVYTDPP